MRIKRNRGTSRTYVLSDGQVSSLEAIARYYGCKWGNQPNVNELLRQIADGKLVVKDLKREFIVAENFNEDGDCKYCHGFGYNYWSGDTSTDCSFCGGTGDDRLINPEAYPD